VKDSTQIFFSAAAWTATAVLRFFHHRWAHLHKNARWQKLTQMLRSVSLFQQNWCQLLFFTQS